MTIDVEAIGQNLDTANVNASDVLYVVRVKSWPLSERSRPDSAAVFLAIYRVSDNQISSGVRPQNETETSHRFDVWSLH